MNIGARLLGDLQGRYGLTPYQAAGFVGNLAHESGGFNTLQEVKPLVPGSRGGFGYAQWTGPRRRAFEAWSAANGLDPTSYEANSGFLFHELDNTPEGRVLDKLRGASSVDEATRVVSDTFLRPGIPHMDSRLAQARKFAGVQPAQSTPQQGILSTSSPQMEAPQMEPQKATGLLGALFPNMSADRQDRLAMALSGLSMNPNMGVMAATQQRMQDRRADRKQSAAQAESMGARQRAAEYVATSLGRPDLAQAIMQGVMSGADAYKVATAPQEDSRTALMQNVEYIRSQNPDLGFDEALQLARSGNVINNNISGDAQPPADATLRDELQKNQADNLAAYMTAGAKAASNMGDLQALRELSQLAPSGPITGRLAQQFPEFSDVSAVRQAIVRRVAPTLRVEGSGSTSDIEYAGMIEGLGNLANTPEANMAIADMMIAKAEIDLQRANLVTQYQNGQIDYQTLNTTLAELGSKSIMPESLRRILQPAQAERSPQLPEIPDFTKMSNEELDAFIKQNGG